MDFQLCVSNANTRFTTARCSLSLVAPPLPFSQKSRSIGSGHTSTLDRHATPYLICVVDLGIGIPAALRRSQIQMLQRDSDAAVVEAAVTRPRLTSRSNQVGGLGLKTIREVVCERGGKLTVLSLGAKLTWTTKETIGKRARPPLFRGTAVVVEFKPTARLVEKREVVPSVF